MNVASGHNTVTALHRLKIAPPVLLVHKDSRDYPVKQAPRAYLDDVDMTALQSRKWAVPMDASCVHLVLQEPQVPTGHPDHKDQTGILETECQPLASECLDLLGRQEMLERRVALEHLEYQEYPEWTDSA